MLQMMFTYNMSNVDLIRSSVASTCSCLGGSLKHMIHDDGYQLNQPNKMISNSLRRERFERMQSWQSSSLENWCGSWSWWRSPRLQSDDRIVILWNNVHNVIVVDCHTIIAIGWPDDARRGEEEFLLIANAWWRKRFIICCGSEARPIRCCQRWEGGRWWSWRLMRR